MHFDSDVIIVGAGVAGLSAATVLARAGLRVVILEGRDRVGGRIFTRRDPDCNAVIELGAEFVHGCPAEIWDLLKRHDIGARELTGESWCVRDEKLSTCDFFSQVDELLEKMDDRTPDQSFLQFVDKCCTDVKMQQTKAMALRYVTGFHAADPSLISVHSLVKGLRADEEIDGDRAFRISTGYESLTKVHEKELARAGVPILLNTKVEFVGWAGRGVELTARDSKGVHSLLSSKALLTLPLGVLQTEVGETAAVRFAPELPQQKQQAIDYLAMGKVIRLTLRFRERFWESIHPQSGRDSKTLEQLQFLLTEDEWFPTWWTTLPEKLPIITGWAPFHAAERLSGKDQSFVVERAVSSLSNILSIRRERLEHLLEAAYFHDWQSDPFSRGAYSYVKVGGDRAQQELGAPLENTLFFAGEATDVTGHNGTVHGAIASGHRAATEILQG